MNDRHGYTYPDEIFKNIGVLTAESKEQELYMELLAGSPTLGRVNWNLLLSV